MPINNKIKKELIQAELKKQIKQSKGWCVITFTHELPNHRPYGFTLNSNPFVLLRNKEGKLACYLLPLQNETNNLGNARVKTVPVVEKQGLVWLWQKDSEKADDSLIPTLKTLDDFDEEGIQILDM